MFSRWYQLSNRTIGEALLLPAPAFLLVARLMLCSALASGGAACVAEGELGHESGELVPIDVAPNMGEGTQIGQGYSQQTSNLTATRCLVGPIDQDRDHAEGSVSLEADVQQSSLDESFSLTASAKASFGLFNGGMRASFAKNSRTDSRSLTYVYKASALLYTDVLRLDETAIPDWVTAALTETDWYSVCGDYFVSAIDRGGALYVALKLDFASQRDKEAYKMSIEARYGTANTDVNLENAKESFNQRVVVSTYGYQAGGNTDELAAILPEGEVGRHCLLGDFEQCTAMISTAIEYARSEAFAGGLRAHPAAMHYYALPYSDVKTVVNAPWQEPSGLVDIRIVQSRERLVNHIKNAVLIDNRIMALRKAAYFGAPEARRATIEGLYIQNRRNVDILQGARPFCYEDLQPGWGGLDCIRRSYDDYLESQGFVSISLADLDVNLRSRTLGDRTDFYVYRTPTPKEGDSWWAHSSTRWTAYAMCPAGTFVTGFKLRAVPPQGGGDDTALQGLITECSNWDRDRTSHHVVTPGWGNYIEAPWATCEHGPLHGVDIRVEKNQHSGGDDTGANDLKGICVSSEEIHPAGGLSWGEFKGEWTRCPSGTAICGVAAQYTPYRGPSGDDTGLNNVSLACCVY